MKTYLPYEPDQQLLLPAALQEWLLHFRRAKVIMMVKVLLYGYCWGWRPNRPIEQDMGCSGGEQHTGLPSPTSEGSSSTYRYWPAHR